MDTKLKLFLIVLHAVAPIYGSIPSGVMLHIIPLSSFCHPKIDVALKITIEFLIYHSWILIQW